MHVGSLLDCMKPKQKFETVLFKTNLAEYTCLVLLLQPKSHPGCYALSTILRVVNVTAPPEQHELGSPPTFRRFMSVGNLTLGQY